MKEIIVKLEELNKLDRRLQTIRKDLARLPKGLAAQEEEVQRLADQIARRREEVVRLKGEADAQDQELKSGMDTLRRLSNQMNVLRTSKEFDVVRRQMDAQRAFNSQIEDKALALMTQVDARQKEVAELEAKLAERQAELDRERARIEREVAELRGQEEGLARERGGLAQHIPAEELAVYDRIVATRGNAITHVRKDGVCAACHMRIPPQVHNLALLAQDLTTCPSCGRILTAKL